MLHILQTGDLHLGKIIYEYSLLDDQKHMLNLLIQELQAFAYDVLIISGDIYDRSIPPLEAISLFDDFLTRVHTEFPNLQICFISGNHDSQKRLSFGSNFFRSQHIYICTEPADCIQPVLLQHAGCVQAALYQIPFLHAGSLTSNSAHGLKTQQELVNEAITRILEAHALLQKSENAYENLPALLNCHLFTIGAISCDSERIFIGTAEAVGSDLFAPFAYTAIGHLHKSQKVTDRAYYAGSPLAYSFSEAKHEKSFLRITLDDACEKKNDSMPGVSVTKIPIVPIHRMIQTESSFEDFENLTDYKNDFIEFVCTDSVLTENAAARLRKHFPFLLSVKQKALELYTNRSNDNLKKKKLLPENPEAQSLREILYAFLEDIGLAEQSESGEKHDEWKKEADLFENIARELAKKEAFFEAP